MECLPAWIEQVAKDWAVDDRTHYAIHLCLEEAISNVIRHGYASGTDNSEITVCCSESPDGQLMFTVEDGAAPFNPLTAPTAPLLDEDGEIPVGGRGLTLLRGFADSLSYEPLANGNRLRIGFAIKHRQ